MTTFMETTWKMTSLLQDIKVHFVYIQCSEMFMSFFSIVLLDLAKLPLKGLKPQVIYSVIGFLNQTQSTRYAFLYLPPSEVQAGKELSILILIAYIYLLINFVKHCFIAQHSILSESIAQTTIRTLVLHSSTTSFVFIIVYYMYFSVTL